MVAIDLTPEVALRLTEEVLDAYGADYVYPEAEGDRKCVYVKGGLPSCLVGQVLVKAGVPLERVAEADYGYEGSGVPAGNLLLNLQDEGYLTLGVGVIPFLAEAQNQQDAGNTWGDAVRIARNASAIKV